MGYAKLECALYVMCRGDKQKKELMKQFEKEHPGNGRLFMWNSHNSPYRIDFAFSNGDFASDLRDDILAIAEWLQAKSKLKMQGYWYGKDEDTAIRWEVLDGEVRSASLMWLKSCTVEHNNMLRKIAEQRFHADFNRE